MNSKQKQKKLSRNISIALAVLIVATLCVTIAALTASRRSRPDSDATSSSNQTANTPQSSSSSSTTPRQLATTPSEQSSSGNSPASAVIEWSCPVDGGVVKEYSADIPVFSLTMEDYRIHAGVDIEGNVGADVLAAADGVITEVRYDPMMGQTVVIKHSDTYTTVYQNMQTVIPEGISVGASVKGGQKIGTVGETALIEISESPHLHFSVLADGKYVNPLSYITVSASAGKVWYED